MDEKTFEALNFIRESLNKYENVAVLSSFGKDSVVLLHLVTEVNPDIRVIFINTPFKPKATLEFKDKVKHYFNLNLKEYMSEYALNEELMENIVIKPKLWRSRPTQCCELLKVKPSIRAVNELNLDAWFSGLRGTESEKRSLFSQVFKQGNFVRLHPLIDWEEWRIWRHIACYHLPIHPYYCRGYRSIGCEPCSNPGGETERAGRWKGTVKCGSDCGIHDVVMRQ